MSLVTELHGLTPFCLVLLIVLAGLDRTALAQTMLCRPIVCGALCGLILNNYAAGITIGGAIELLWLMRMPVGATISPDDTQASIAAVTLFCVFGDEIGAGLPTSVLMTLLVFFAAAFAPVGRCVDIGAKHLNGCLLHRLETRSSMHGFPLCGHAAGLFNLLGLVNFSLAALLSQAIILLAVLASALVVLPLLADVSWSFPDVYMYAVFLAGIASVLSCIRVRYGNILFLAGFGATLLFLQV